MVNVYMPTDYGNSDSYEDYNELCAKITAMYNDADAVYLLVLGDFNCSLYSRFYNLMSHFMSDNDLICSDLTRLYDTFTYCRDDGRNTSWIDHFLCSKALDVKITSISVLYDYICSDHKPMSVQFSGVSPEMRQLNDSNSGASNTFCHIEWSRVNINDFQNSMSSALQLVDIPTCLLGCTENPCVCADHRTAIDNYYQSIIRQVFDVSVLHSVKRRHNNRSVPGWTDYVADKHDVAKNAFKEWVYAGKPRSSAVFSEMSQTRAAFKLALRYCRRHADQLKADGMAKDLLQQNSNNKFWKNVSRINAQKINKYATKVGDAAGERNICHMWQQQFANLYSSVECSKDKERFMNRINRMSNTTCSSTIDVTDIIDAINSQKKEKVLDLMVSLWNPWYMVVTGSGPTSAYCLHFLHAIATCLLLLWNVILYHW